MNSQPLALVAIVCGALLAAPAADAQPRRAAAASQPSRQMAPPGVATFATPSPSGLTPPMPASLTPPMPPSLNLPGPPNISAPGVAPGSPPIDAGVAQPLAPSGVAVVTVPYARGSANAMGFGRVPGGRYSAVDIARAFLDADINHDGDLSRDEAMRLEIPVPFDALDRNHDGVLTRFEYDDFFTP